MKKKKVLNGNEKNPGLEYLDPKPMEVPAELRRPESMDEKIRRIIRTNLSEQAAAQGRETFEEADDFEVEDSFDADGITSQYDLQDMDSEFPIEEKLPAIGSSRQKPEKGERDLEDPAPLSKLMRDYTKDQLVEALIEMEKKHAGKNIENDSHSSDSISDNEN